MSVDCSGFSQTYKTRQEKENVKQHTLLSDEIRLMVRYSVRCQTLKISRRDIETILYRKVISLLLKNF